MTSTLIPEIYRSQANRNTFWGCLLPKRRGVLIGDTILQEDEGNFARYQVTIKKMSNSVPLSYIADLPL